MQDKLDISEVIEAASDVETLPLNRLIYEGCRISDKSRPCALSRGTVSPREVKEKQMQGIIGKDEETVKSYMKVQVPEPEMVQGLFTAIGEVFAGFLKKNAKGQ